MCYVEPDEWPTSLTVGTEPDSTAYTGILTGKQATNKVSRKMPWSLVPCRLTSPDTRVTPSSRIISMHGRSKMFKWFECQAQETDLAHILVLPLAGMGHPAHCFTSSYCFTFLLSGLNEITPLKGCTPYFVHMVTGEVNVKMGLRD